MGFQNFVPEGGKNEGQGKDGYLRGILPVSSSTIRPVAFLLSWSCLEFLAKIHFLFFDACRARAKPQAPAHCTPIAYAGALILYYYRSTTVAFILVDNCYTQLYGCSFNASVAE